MTIEQYRKRSPYSMVEYLLVLRKLLPRGRPWGFEIKATSNVWYDQIYPGEGYIVYNSLGAADTVYNTIQSDFDIASTWLGRYLSVFAEELRKLSERAYELVNESVPGLSNELLPEWLELTVANNDEWVLIEGSKEDQRLFAHGKKYNQGKLVNAQFFIDYGDLLGFELAVDEYPLESLIISCSIDAGDTEAAISGVCGVVADEIAQPNVYGCGSHTGLYNVIEITIVSGTGNLELMQNLFAYAKPAHMVIVWVDAR